MRSMATVKRIILSAVFGTLLTAAAFYITLPPINIHSTEFWMFLTFATFCYAFPFLFKKKDEKNAKSKNGKKSQLIFGEKVPNVKISKIALLVVLLPVAVLIIGSLVSTPVFNARGYASVITVKEAVFEEDMQQTDEVTNIALMDSASAKIIGNRTLGSLSDVVSQYEIGARYTQINYKVTPKKVANLEYADFFKWFNNRDKGVPGYVMVDPVNNSAEYVKLEKPLEYVSSGYFGDNLLRKLRFDYPTKIFDFVSFEIDDEGKPYYVVSCVDAKVMLFGAMDVSEVIIFDPCTGESELYDVAEVPSWVDAVYSGDLAEEKYNWYGTLSGGYINSIIGNKDCKMTTDDYGFIVIEDDVWYFTGVTSVTSDESNIGFIISNARTGEYKYYPVVGAEEYSAMRAAEGEVQEKGYVASFPSLINASGKATYIMVLKDAGGLVKLYALVNVENYGIVATGSTQAEAMQAYKALLAENGVVEKEPEPETETFTTEINVLSVRDVVIEGNTFVYIEGDDGVLYKGSVAEDESLLLVKQDDRISVKYIATGNEKIRNITEYSYVSE